MIKEKNVFEKLFDCELESSTINNESKGIFYIDNGHSFDKGRHTTIERKPAAYLMRNGFLTPSSALLWQRKHHIRLRVLAVYFPIIHHWQFFDCYTFYWNSF
jgi:hypothetical protein